METEHLNRIYADAPTYAKEKLVETTYAKEKLVETTERSMVAVDSSRLPRLPAKSCVAKLTP